MNSSTSFICLLGSVKVRFLSVLFVDVVFVKKFRNLIFFSKKLDLCRWDKQTKTN